MFQDPLQLLLNEAFYNLAPDAPDPEDQALNLSFQNNDPVAPDDPIPFVLRVMEAMPLPLPPAPPPSPKGSPTPPPAPAWAPQQRPPQCLRESDCPYRPRARRQGPARTPKEERALERLHWQRVAGRRDLMSLEAAARTLEDQEHKGFQKAVAMTRAFLNTFCRILKV
jgi:hypothetical protein